MTPEDVEAYNAAMAERLHELTQDADSLEAVLWDLGFHLRYCPRDQHHWWRFSKQGKPWQRGNDRLDAHVRRTIERNYEPRHGKTPKLRYGEDTWRHAMAALLYHREQDHFAASLASAPEWDGEPRVDSLLKNLFDSAEPANLAAWASRFLLLGPIQRAYKPGSKLDETPVLVGPQGIGKSTALSHLFPETWRPWWFGDGLHLAATRQERVEQLQGRVLVEVSEMAGSSRADLESLKAFLSSTNDGNVRLAYRRNPEVSLRRCVFVGTTNDVESLPNDSTGNRRFVAITVTGDEHNAAWVRSYLNANRAQLWAEALVLSHQGREARLPEALKASQAETNAAHRRRDHLLEDALEAFVARQGGQPFTLHQAAEGIGFADSFRPGVQLSRRDQARLIAALKTMGAEQTRTPRDEAGKRERAWQIAGVGAAPTPSAAPSPPPKPAGQML